MPIYSKYMYILVYGPTNIYNNLLSFLHSGYSVYGSL